MRVIPIKSVLLAGALLALVSVTASANTITPRFVSFTPGDRIVYDADFTSGELHAGDGFTIYDIGGFAGFGFIDPLWTATATNFGTPFVPPAPPGLVVPPDRFDENVHFTYIGPTIQQLAVQVFGPFEVLTTGTLLAIEDWKSADHTIGTIGIVGDGTPAGVGGATIVTVAAVPEPGSTMAFLGLGLMAVGMLRRKALI